MREAQLAAERLRASAGAAKAEAGAVEGQERRREEDVAGVVVVEPGVQRETRVLHREADRRDAQRQEHPAEEVPVPPRRGQREDEHEEEESPSRRRPRHG